ncbi:Multiple antibiotic resistance protein MarR [Mycobacterium talmoniae]|uniref:Multiple antibiotic resistance protein MarR n=1 Tax=Mycobacterium talmoniae TaxID=1858794 RepID=A0A2S8BFT8_9MYCO|nr:Multiple antibiotic resistance protein MarR [Mycobacterium talmoniae]
MTGTMPTEDESLDAITDALLTASRLLVAISAHSIAQLDETITIPQFRTLVLLGNHGPINLATLAGLLGVQPSAAGRMVDRLVGAGLIDRLPHPTSRRELLAALTERGTAVVREVTSQRRARSLASWNACRRGTAGAGAGPDGVHRRRRGTRSASRR